MAKTAHRAARAKPPTSATDVDRAPRDNLTRRKTMRYRLRVVDAGGTIRSVALDAADHDEALRNAKARSLTVLSVDAEGGARLALGWGRRRFDATLFCEELLSMLEAGLSIVECVEGLASKEESSEAREMFARMLSRLREGRRLSDAMADEQRCFPPLLVAIMRASETTSSMTASLERYLRYQAQIEAITRKLASASIYPLILLIVGTLVTLFLLGYVVPQFSAVYRNTGRELPAMSRLLIGWGEFAGRHSGTLLLGFAALVGAGAWAFARLLRGEGIVGLLAKVPWLGERARLIELSRLYMTQGMLMSAGIAASDALHMASRILSPQRRQSCERALDAIRSGRSMSESLQEAGLTTPISVKYLRAGERSGNLAEMLSRAARFYDDEMTRFVDRFSRAFEPILMAAIGIVIGTIVVMLYLPIFELAGGLS
jgi:general secretion pathway protein F